MLFKKKSSEPLGPRTRISPASPPKGTVFSYYANRSVRTGSAARSIEEQQQEIAAQRAQKLSWLRRLPTIALLLVLLVLVASMLQLSSNAKVVTVNSGQGGIFLRDRKIYEAAAHQAFASLLNANKLTVDASGISSRLRQEFPELRVVSVSLPIVGNRPVVYIQAAAPKFILSSRSGTYVLDSDGRAVITDNQVPQTARLGVPVVTDESGLQIAVGHIALPRDTVSFITEVVGQLKAKGLSVTSLTLPAGTNELYVRLNGVGYYVKFNLHSDAREEAGTFLAVKDSLAAMHKTPGEYVDVRVKSKAYYK
jgi:hypothetical protein